jgi:ABC-type multidrug transport system fused ATPase/permease subunit
VKWAANFSSVEKILNTPVVRNEFARKINKNWKTLKIENLRFRYNVSLPDQTSKHKQIFKGFTLLLTNRSKTAVTGASGSGKSTLFKLLRGLYTPDTVTLYIDSVKHEDFGALSSQVTLIPQLPDIFENTIRYNITLGSTISKCELDTIIHTTGLEPVLARLKSGLDSDVREKGVNLSGGERQRIALARGLFAAKQSSIILLDEVTSNIDMVLEEEIFKRIFNIYSDRCIIASVHRLYLLKMFDSVYEIRPNHKEE